MIIRKRKLYDLSLEGEPCAQCGEPLFTAGEEDYIVSFDYETAEGYQGEELFCSSSCARKHCLEHTAPAELAVPYADLA